MTTKANFIVVAAIAAGILGSPVAAMAQSAWTTGTAASREAAGFPSPYGGAYGHERGGSRAFAMVPHRGHATYGTRDWR